MCGDEKGDVREQRSETWARGTRGQGMVRVDMRSKYLTGTNSAIIRCIQSVCCVSCNANVTVVHLRSTVNHD